MPSSRSILTFEQYATVRHPTPYLVDVRGGGGRLLLFGGLHSSDPADPMFDQIEALFSSVRPAVVLHEGTPPFAEPDREIAIRRHGEAGLLRHLAARAGIETASMDIPLPDEARRLRDEIGGSGDAIVFLVVRQLASFNRKTARMDYDGYFRDFFDLIGPALDVDRLDWPLIEVEHRRVLGTPLEPRRVTAWQTDPMLDELPTQRIARLSNRMRDEHMLARLVDAVEEYQRVLATVGVSHAVMLEPALRATLAR